MKVLEIRNLSKRYRSCALQEVSLELEEGYVMGLIGPNGAGKTTLIKLLLNLVPREGGEIRMFGLDALRHEREIKSRIGFVHETDYLIEDLTPLGMQQVVRRAYPRWEEKLYRGYLERFGLDPRRKIKTFSKGMRTKCALAIAFSHQAELLIMDEPTSGLDPLVRAEIVDLIAEQLQSEKRSFLISSHITSDLDKIADYVTLLDRGRVVLSASRNDIVENHHIVKGPLELLSNGTARLFLRLRTNPYGFQGLTNRLEEVRAALGAQIVVERPNLEDIMLFTIKGERS
jgi:ABC-2 type transport system ATP-binding protein